MNMKSSLLELPKQSFIDRREFLRISTDDVFCTISILDEKATVLKGKVENISQEGFLAKIDKPVKVSKTVDINLHLPYPYQNLKIEGRIIWVIEHDYPQTHNEGFLVGISFPSWADPSKISQIKKFVSDNFSPNKVVDRRKKDRRAKESLKSSGEQRKGERRLTKSIFKKCVSSSRIDFLNKHKEMYLRSIISKSDQLVSINGYKDLISFSACDYLGLSTHPKIKKAIKDALDKYNTDTASSRLLGGTFDIYNQLEKRLAEFIGGEECITYVVGYLANMGCIPSIANKHDVILSDDKNHASIIDAAILSQSTLLPYKHNNMKDLENKLQKCKGNKLIVTDGVFSMDGEIALLDEIYYLGQKYNAAIYIDDAHAIGVLGKTGAGTSEHFGLKGKIDIVMGTLNKTIPCLGGFIVAKKKIIDYLKWTSRSFIFSASIPPQMVCGVLASLDVMRDEPERMQNLWRNIRFMKENLVKLGFDVGNSQTSVIPVLIRDEIKTYKMALMLQDLGIFADAIYYPAVKKKESRFRLALSANHTLEQLEKTIEAFKKAGKAVNIIS
ncbi:MAG: aminotransferase class I/II-fold pyridoxal phosphate-dependent enzyme [Endomicrobiales bacterium]|nr:aminotransferase class I/II-fold pyridoxal phosphate-dependent enzyme [Endomicrobiales bacterium]